MTHGIVWEDVQKKMSKLDELRIPNSKLYLESPWTYEKYKIRIVGISPDIIAFGEQIGKHAEKWIHFKRKDWEDIKRFIDQKIKENE